jgi:hypothetical protein
MKKKISRRKFTTTVAGLAAAGLSGVALAGSDPTLATPVANKAFKPPDTTISNLGFDDKKIATLTDAAKQITKKDLAKLQRWIAGGKKGDAPLKLTEKDLDSVNAAWKAYKEKQARISPAPVAACASGGCGCCCTCR